MSTLLLLVVEVVEKLQGHHRLMPLEVEVAPVVLELARDSR